MTTSLALCALLMTQTPVTAARPETSQMQFPQIKGYGGVVALPNASHQPHKGIKVAFDVTAGEKPNGLNKGLERVARFANLMALGGVKTTDYQATIVLHGDATKAILNDSAFAARFKSANPNLPLIKQLHESGIEIAVCGQALAAKEFNADEVTPEAKVVLAAVMMMIDRQAEGYAQIVVP